MNQNKYKIILVIIVLALGLKFLSGNIFSNENGVGDNKGTDNNTAKLATTSIKENQGGKVIYINTKYSFEISLPDSWQGFSEVVDEWEGDSIGSNGEVIVGIEKGPIILVRHPKWTNEVPRQDVPVMIFTRSQWEDVIEEKINIGAGPIFPSEIGRNQKYIFALPARYNYTYLPGFEEVGQILDGKNLKTF